MCGAAGDDGMEGCGCGWPGSVGAKLRNGELEEEEWMEAVASGAAPQRARRRRPGRAGGFGGPAGSWARRVSSEMTELGEAAENEVTKEKELREKELREEEET